jgi:hypothetical protein
MIGVDLAEALVEADQREEAGIVDSAAASRRWCDKLAAVPSTRARRNSPASPNG